MNRVIAYQLLACGLSTYRSLGYEQLREIVGNDSTRVSLAADGVEYQVFVRVLWRNGEGRDILVRGSVTESAWGAPHDSVDDEFVVPCPATNEQ